MGFLRECEIFHKEYFGIQAPGSMQYKAAPSPLASPRGGWGAPLYIQCNEAPLLLQCNVQCKATSRGFFESGTECRSDESHITSRLT